MSNLSTKAATAAAAARASRAWGPRLAMPSTAPQRKGGAPRALPMFILTQSYLSPNSIGFCPNFCETSRDSFSEERKGSKNTGLPTKTGGAVRRKPTF